MTSTETALRELQERSAITDLLYRYAKGIDDQAPERIIACFAPDIHLDMLGQHFEGIEIVSRLFRGELGNPKGAGIGRIKASTHVLANILIEIDGDSATSDTQCIANLHVERGGTDAFLVRGIRYLDRLIRLDRCWRIAGRVHTAAWQYETVPVAPS